MGELGQMLDTMNDKVMRLLSQVIFSDGHVFPSEVNALVEGAQRLGIQDKTGKPLTDDQCKIWFQAYMNELNNNDRTEPHDVVITKLVLSLAEWKDKASIVETLEAISLADSNFHQNEKRMLSLVKTFWQYDGLEVPRPTILMEQ